MARTGRYEERYVPLGRLQDHHELTTELGVPPTRLEVSAGFLDVSHRFEAEFATQPALDDRRLADLARGAQFAEGRPSGSVDDGTFAQAAKHAPP
jgi:hypothetical protein